MFEDRIELIPVKPIKKMKGFLKGIDTNDKEDLFAFYDFPAAHWIHLRTTNPIESTFATVRLRHRRTKGNGTRKATLAMVYKLCREAEKSWRKLDGFKLIPLVEAGKKFVNGVQVNEAAA